ncbi:hypothetical protein [Aliidiomarina indica]|uniref:hypothetical protein n=1 Tax=Aliidiomarina indica TaxID=2749147 RepID=UPI00189031F2|nr:hypothetical protein [Aliidiomarina indica]
MAAFRGIVILILAMFVSGYAWASVPVLEQYPQCEYSVLSEVSETEQVTWRSRTRTGYVEEPERSDFQPVFDQALAKVQQEARAANAAGIILTRVDRTLHEVSGTQSVRMRVTIEAQLVSACQGPSDAEIGGQATPFNRVGERQQRSRTQTISHESSEVDLSALQAQLSAERASAESASEQEAHDRLLAHSERVDLDDVVAALRALELSPEQAHAEAGVTALQNLPLLHLSQPQDFEQSYAVSLWLSFTLSGDNLTRLYLFPQHPEATPEERTALLQALNIPTTADGIDAQFRNITWGVDNFTFFADHFTLEGQLDSAAPNEPVTQISIQFHPVR